MLNQLCLMVAVISVDTYPFFGFVRSDKATFKD